MKNILKYLGLIKIDLKTLHWTTSEELKKSYLIVLIFALILGSYVFGLDYFLTYFYKLIIF